MKISIIGAGPIGCYAAYLLKEYEVEIYEEHSIIGKPVSCTGLVSKDIKEIVRLKDDFLVNRFKNVEVFSAENSARFRIEDYLLDRFKFDNHLAELAESNGVKINLSGKFVGTKDNKFLIKTKNKTIKKTSDILIGADGPNSSIAKIINPNQQIKYYIGKQARIKGDFEKDCYKAYLNASPDFLGWVVPENEEIARVGIASRHDTNIYFDKFIKKLKMKNIINYQAGLIPLFNPHCKVQKGKTYIVGDAAMQVKATTGGGLVPGLKSARILSRCLKKEEDYEKKISGIKRELSTHLWIRRILNRFSERDYDEFVGISGIHNNLFERYTRDSSIKLLLNLILKEPRLLKFIKYII